MEEYASSFFIKILPKVRFLVSLKCIQIILRGETVRHFNFRIAYFTSCCQPNFPDDDSFPAFSFNQQMINV
ncbi:hypothetical protein T4D_1876 [Trichinella pseudospiralis]|uniref:Uncharacterized protein n=1 Tax=Trichinella pseudospiralis TaxID=6337 RepID=A0A0V1FWK9_TRIPS|nr:hypothetical protein T4D_1876 [Trichinella pseudospiralis]